MKTDFKLKLDEPISNRDQNLSIRYAADYIEQYFKSEGIQLRVVVINSNPEGLEFCCKIPLGTPLSNILKHQKQLVEILAAPHKKVDLQLPIPGTDVIGITIPWVYPYVNLPFIETPIPITEKFAKHWRTKLSVKLFRLSEKLGGPTLCQSIG